MWQADLWKESTFHSDPLVLPNLNILPINKTWAHRISAIHLGSLWLCQLQLTLNEIHNEDNKKLFLEQTGRISGGQLFTYNYTECNKSQRHTQDSIHWVCKAKRQFCQLQFFTAALKTSSSPASSLLIRPIYYQKCAARWVRMTKQSGKEETVYKSFEGLKYIKQ